MTFKLEEENKKTEPKEKKDNVIKEKTEEFKPQRFPTYFKFGKNGEEKPIIKVPLGGDKSIRFLTDVENEYFVRVEDPGELTIAVLKYANNDTEGGTKPGIPKKVDELFHLQKSNPQDGTIKISLAPTNEVKINDTMEIKATLTNPGGDFETIVIVKIVEPNPEKEKVKKEDKADENKIGLPDLTLVYKDAKEGEIRITWNQLDDIGISMDYKTIVHPFAEGDVLKRIYVNLDSSVLKDYKSTLKSEDQFEIAEKKYYSSVYFHTLFLYTISKSKKYSMKKETGEESQDVDLVDYVKEVFESYYAQFLLNFGMSELVQSLEN